MIWRKILLVLLITLPLIAFGTASARSEYQSSQDDKYPPPTTTDTGTRPMGETCLRDDKAKIHLFVPHHSDETQTPFGLTLSQHPTLLFYLPEANATRGELTFRDPTQKGKRYKPFRLEFTLPDREGIGAIALPPQALAEFKAETWYQWSIAIICQQSDRTKNVTSRSGWIQRIEPNAALAERLKNANDDQRPDICANNGIWYDAVSQLYDLLRQDPENEDLQVRWISLLHSAGLSDLAQYPLLDCQIIKPKS